MYAPSLAFLPLSPAQVTNITPEPVFGGQVRGIYLWVKLPEGVDFRQFAGPAMQEGIGFIPGPDWSADPEAAANYIRLCFALPTEAEVWEGIEKLARVFQPGGGKV